MKGTLHAIAFALLSATASQAVTVTYEFEDFDFDETFNVFVSITGGSNGLATYNVALSGLDASPLDPSTFFWAENRLSNLGADFVTRGFTAGLLRGPIGTDAYSAANSQFLQTPIFGVGQFPIFIEGFLLGAPNTIDVELDVPALLGTLTIPGANGLSDAELGSLLASNAAVFPTGSTDPGVVEAPDAVESFVKRIDVPEPSTAPLVGLALAGLAIAARLPRPRFLRLANPERESTR